MTGWKDIKERVRDKNPKIRNPAARLPKRTGSLSAVLEAKEKPRELHEKSSGQSDSLIQYGTENRIRTVQGGERGRKNHRENHISGWKKTCRSDLQEDKGKKKQTGRSERCRRSNGAGSRKRKEINQAETRAGGTCQGEW